MPDQVDAQKKQAMIPWKSQAGAGSLQGMWRKEPTWSKFSGRTCDPIENPQQSSLFWRIVSHEKYPVLEKRKNVRPLPHEEEGASETACGKLVTAPIPHSLVLLGAGDREN